MSVKQAPSFSDCYCVFIVFVVMEFCDWFPAFSPSSLTAALLPPMEFYLNSLLGPGEHKLYFSDTIGLPDSLASGMPSGTHHRNYDHWPYLFG